MHKTNTKTPEPNFHQPVLLESVLKLLEPRAGERYLDLTAGYGGHAAIILDKVGREGHHLLIDRDEQAVEYLKNHISGNAEIIHGDFESVLEGIDEGFDIVLADLGVSSPQLDNINRGFSFQTEAPLDMRMDQSRGQAAADLVNTASEQDLADIIYRYGEERLSRRIARVIVDNRPIKDTKQLASLVTRAYKGKYDSRSKVHPATRTFQALRIAVNDELGQLERSLPMIEKALNPGGRMAIISFHSLEDRIVKRFIADSSLEPLNKKVVQGKDEDASNPRARSAKLRAAIKNTNKGRPRANSRQK